MRSVNDASPPSSRVAIDERCDVAAEAAWVVADDAVGGVLDVVGRRA